MTSLTRQRTVEDFNVFSVDEYCRAEKVSRAKLYQEWREGRGPRYMMRGNRRQITVEAARDYRRQLEGEAEAQRAASQRDADLATAG